MPALPVRPGWIPVLFLLALLVPAAQAQHPPLPPQPVPVAPPAATFAPPTPLAYVPAPPPVVGPAPGPAPVLVPSIDPGPDGWGPYGSVSDCPGWFFSTEAALVFPALKFRLVNDMPLPQTGLQLHVPSVDLDLTVMPTFEAGYRLGGSAGFFALSYSFLFAEGTGHRDTLGGPADVRTRAEVNWLDLDYGTTPYEFAPRYTISWRLGARIVDLYFDSQASNPALIQSASNDFFGAGPHARLDLERRIVFLPGLSLFGRLDGAVFIGRIKQNFSVALPNGLEDGLGVRRTQTVPYVNLQAGLSYVPPSLPGLKVTTGYLFENYFNAGRLGVDGTGEVSQSRGELWSHGWFVRAQVDF